MQYILDTDHVTLLQQLHPQIVERIESINSDDIGITVVTVEEQLQGWLSAIRKYSQTSQADRLIWAYQGLRDIIKYLTRFQIVDFSLDAYNLFRKFRQQKIRIGTQDLRIAAIVLSQNYILVTRNQKDFSQVPNLQIEDWTCK
jgi:tRNA(fMet)-specific endonuclease VapC